MPVRALRSFTVGISENIFRNFAPLAEARVARSAATKRNACASPGFGESLPNEGSGTGRGFGFGSGGATMVACSGASVPPSEIGAESPVFSAEFQGLRDVAVVSGGTGEGRTASSPAHAAAHAAASTAAVAAAPRSFTSCCP